MITFTDELQREAEICVKERDKKNVYIIQYNTPSSRNLMPLAAGLLYSYTKTDPKLTDNFNFRIEMSRGSPDSVIDSYHNPAIAAFSLYFWNFRQSIEVAKRLKERYPEILIIFGGPSAPLYEKDTKEFFADHPFVDITVAAEGEQIFSEILHAYIDKKDYNEIPGISVRKDRDSVNFQAKRPYIKDISVIPSPFLDGTFDDLVARHRNDITGVVWETNRGCPFTCTFCFWGGPDSKISQFPVERVYAELDWISKNKIAYVFGADANFGILKRDVEIARYMAKLNRETGFPKFFVINWTKNATEKIFEIVDELKESDVKFMMTTSIQSHNPETLKAIKRQNIKLDSFEKILTEANKRNFNTYSELILGLPLETYQTFSDGLRKILTPELHYHFNIYCCVLIPGTAMADPEYIKQYEIETRRCVMNLGKTVHSTDTVQEYENLVVSTSTMPVSDWRRCHTIAYMTKALYGFRSAFFILNYLKRELQVDSIEFVEFLISESTAQPRYKTLRYALQLLSALQDSIINNGNETVAIEGVATSLHAEMAAIIAFMSDKMSFYRELNELVKLYANQKNVDLINEVYEEVFIYQVARMPTWVEEPSIEVVSFKHNISQFLVSGYELSSDPSTWQFDHTIKAENADDFLKKHIYGGMIFSLRAVLAVADQANAIAAAEIFQRYFSTDEESNSLINKSKRGLSEAAL